MRYYSHWLYSAVHVLTSIPEINSAERIAHYLKRDITEIRPVVDFLLEAKLLISTEEGLNVGSQRIHLAATSPLFQAHHRNMHLRAMDNQLLPARQESEFRFSGFMALSSADAERIRGLLVEFLVKQEKITRDSPEETMRAIHIDFYQV